MKLHIYNFSKYSNGTKLTIAASSVSTNRNTADGDKQI